MNAIILYASGAGKRAGRDDVAPGLTCLAGKELLAYTINGLARLSLTRFIMVFDRPDSRVKDFINDRLPKALVKYVHLPSGSGVQDLTALAAGVEAAENTGLLVIEGNSLFGPELLTRMVLAGEGAVAYSRKTAGRKSPPMGRANAFAGMHDSDGRSIMTGEAAGLWYIPRSYLSPMRGVIVELAASGGPDLFYHAAFQLMIGRGFAFSGICVDDFPYARIDGQMGLAAGTAAALDIQRKGWPAQSAPHHERGAADRVVAADCR